MTRQQLVDQFGDKGHDVPLISDMQDSESSKWKKYEDRDDVARVWEFWDKRKKKVYKIAEGYENFLEDPLDDPLTLRGFFPCPKPLYMVKTTSNLEPIAEYKMYEDRANAVYRLTQRIDFLIEWAKVSGWYDGELAAEVSRVIKSPEGGIKAVDNFQRFRDMGGSRGVIEWFPIEQFVNAVMILSQERDQEKQLIYEIVGITDIMRGIAKPRVTKGGAELEAQFTSGRSSRVGRKQKKSEEFLRDLLRIMAEVIAEQFEPETMFQMTGVQPDPQTMAGMQQVIETLRDEKLRNYKIDVETSSTVAPNEAKEKEEINEFMPAFTQAMMGFVQAAQQGVMDPQVAKEILLKIVRRYDFGREVEDLIDQGVGQQGGQKEDPEKQAKMAEQQLKQAELQLKQQKLVVDMQRDRQELALKAAELEQNGQIEQAKIMQKEREALIKLQSTIINAQGGKG